MNKLSSLMVLCLLAACGHTQEDSIVYGPILGVEHRTPLFCSDYDVLVIGAGAGSTVELWIPPQPASVPDQLRGLMGRPMGFVYDEGRASTRCGPSKELRPNGRRADEEAAKHAAPGLNDGPT